MSDSPSSADQSSTASAPKVADHTFYLFDDTDEVTRTLCGYGCAFGPEDHISPEAFEAAQRIRDAAPQMLEALEAFKRAEQHDQDELYDGCDDDCDAAITLWAEAIRLTDAAIAAARPAPTGDGDER